MKRLLLLRHAKSSWDEPGLADHDRPLAPRGLRASKRIAEHFRAERIAPELVLCSTSTRTRETLEGILPALVDDVKVRMERDIYAASSPQLLELLHGLEDRVASAMLIGHNPGIEDLAVELASRGEQLGELRAKFPTAALATLVFGGDWRDLAPGRAELVAFVKPRDLEPT
jgi:phosphohistidine phosphatase